MKTPFPGPEILQCSVPGPQRGLVSVGTHVLRSREEDSLKAAIASQMQQQHAETSIDDHGFYVEK